MNSEKQGMFVMEMGGILILSVVLVLGLLTGGIFLGQSGKMHSNAMMKSAHQGRGMMGAMHQWMHGSSTERDYSNNIDHKTAPKRDGKNSKESQSKRVTFHLRSVYQPRMAFQGMSGPRKGRINPDLKVHQGDTVTIRFTNRGGGRHDLAIPELDLGSTVLNGRGDSTTFTFVADQPGEYTYYCTVAGHRQAGMEGNLVVAPGERSD